MQPISKVIVAVLLVALIAVIGLIVVRNSARQAPAAEATVQPEATMTPEPEKTPETEANDEAQPGEAAQEAQEEDAQGTMYEGALAGMTEEEIAQQALLEERNGEANRADD